LGVKGPAWADKKEAKNNAGKKKPGPAGKKKASERTSPGLWGQ